jgi:hypothetical protein
LDKPKVIYKYTHAQAVADGELRKIDWPVKVPRGPAIPLYISKDAAQLFEKEDDATIAEAAAYALLMDSPITSWSKRLKCSHNSIDYELVRGFAIRDDDKREYICTIVAPGER